MKNFYIAVMEREDDKFGAYVIRTNQSNNLAHQMQRDKIVAATICETKKQADALAKNWNDGFKSSGRYLFEVNYD